MNKIDLAKKLHKWTQEAIKFYEGELISPQEFEDLDPINKSVYKFVAKKVIKELKTNE